VSLQGLCVVNYRASLAASDQLDFFGQSRDALQAAEETATASRFDRDVTALTTLSSGATAHFQMRPSQDRLRPAPSCGGRLASPSSAACWSRRS